MKKGDKLLKQSRMTKIERITSSHLTQCIDGQLTDSIDHGEWTLKIGGKEFVVEYLPSSPGKPAILTLGEDNENGDYVVKRRFKVEILVTEVKK